MSKFEDPEFEYEAYTLYQMIYTHHHDVYKELEEMEEKIIEDTRVEFVGEKYKNPPRDTLPELIKASEELDKRLKRIKDSNFPEIVIKEIEEHRNDKLEKIKNKDFIKHTEIDDLKYKEEYEKIHKKFYNSRKYNQLLESLDEKKIEIFKKYVDPSKYPTIYTEYHTDNDG